MYFKVRGFYNSIDKTYFSTFILWWCLDTFMFKPVYDLIFLQTMHISWKGHGQDFDDSVRGSSEPNVTGIIRVQQPWISA